MVVEDAATAYADLLKKEGANYALLDAARDPRVRAFILEHVPEAQSLYAGFEDDLADVAPYLLPLTTERIDALLPLAWGNSWGVFMRSAADMDALRRHFRKFLMVQLESGEEVYFRYYDPRVLRAFIPTCDADQRDTFFGPVASFAVEDNRAPGLVVFAKSSRNQS